MARQIIDTGTLALNGQDGDTNREAAEKCNANFQELYAEDANFVRGAGVVVGGAIAVFAGTTGTQLASRPASDFEPAQTVGTAAQYRNGLKALTDFAASVRASVLTGLSVATSSAVVAADSVLGAIGKLQAQITAAATAFAGDVRGTVLSGLSMASGAAITATDSVLVAFGKLQAQATAQATAAAIALRAVTPAADTVAYFTSGTAAATSAFTAKARALLARTDAAGMRSEIAAAASGANSDITSLSALTTAFSIAQGGTGATSAAAARTSLGVDVTLASAVLDPQTAGGLMSSTVVSGWRIDKFANGVLRMSGNLGQTSTVAAGGAYTNTYTLPSGNVDQGVMFATVTLAVQNSNDHYGCTSAVPQSLTSIQLVIKNGPVSQFFGISISIIGRWKA